MLVPSPFPGPGVEQRSCCRSAGSSPTARSRSAPRSSGRSAPPDSRPRHERGWTLEARGASHPSDQASGAASQCAPAAAASASTAGSGAPFTVRVSTLGELVKLLIGSPRRRRTETARWERGERAHPDSLRNSRSPLQAGDRAVVARARTPSITRSRLHRRSDRESITQS